MGVTDGACQSRGLYAFDAASARMKIHYHSVSEDRPVKPIVPRELPPGVRGTDIELSA